MRASNRRVGNSSAEIILASGSPRRIELLSGAGFRFQVMKPNVDENMRRGESAARFVRRLALEKALSIVKLADQANRKSKRRSSKKRKLIIAADTIVLAPNGPDSPDRKILGKPADPRDARRMLRTLSGDVHTVLTGYSIVEISPSGDLLNKHTRVVRSKVKIRSLNEKQIAAYVASGEPKDKAGAYAAQGIGMNFVEEIRGSFTNVVGLPMSQFLSDLETLFNLPYLPKRVTTKK